MFKKIKLYLLYRKTLKSNIKMLRDRFIIKNKNDSYIIRTIKLDWLCRIGTVLNFRRQSQEDIDKYGYYLMDNEVKKFMTEMEIELKSMGLFELYGLVKADQLDKVYQSDNDKVLIIIDFKLFDTSAFARKIILYGLLFIATLLIILLKIF